MQPSVVETNMAQGNLAMLLLVFLGPQRTTSGNPNPKISNFNEDYFVHLNTCLFAFARHGPRTLPRARRLRCRRSAAAAAEVRALEAAMKTRDAPHAMQEDADNAQREHRQHLHGRDVEDGVRCPVGRLPSVVSSSVVGRGVVNRRLSVVGCPSPFSVVVVVVRRPSSAVVCAANTERSVVVNSGTSRAHQAWSSRKIGISSVFLAGHVVLAISNLLGPEEPVLTEIRALWERFGATLLSTRRFLPRSRLLSARPELSAG